MTYAHSSIHSLSIESGSGGIPCPPEGQAASHLLDLGTLLSMPTKLLPIGNSILSYILQRMPSHITTVA